MALIDAAMEAQLKIATKECTHDLYSSLVTGEHDRAVPDRTTPGVARTWMRLTRYGSRPKYDRLYALYAGAQALVSVISMVYIVDLANQRLTLHS